MNIKLIHYFLKVHSNGSKGDQADSFSFATLFPTVLQPGVSVIANTVFMVLLKCKVCKKPVRRYDIGAPTGITISVPGAESQDAERRRQIALRALSERLSKTETEPLNKQWPSMNDPEEEEAAEIANKDKDESDLMSVNETVKDVQGAPV